ncbi:MAG: hypothetical protein Q7S28_01825 [bacterium]|nr:hypothetical protein [bacterium]
MILSTHMVIGAAAASLFPRYPEVGFLAAFGSHFIADAIPHWHYHLNSMVHYKDNPLHDDMTIGKNFIFDMGKIGIDCVIGFLAALLIFGPTPAFFVGIVGGMFPDFLQFVYWKMRREPLTSLQRFHKWVHAKTRLDSRPFLGISSQIAIIMFFPLVAKTIDLFAQ